MSSVLYDAPGPRARRRTLVATVVALAVVAVLVVLAVRRLAANDQFDPDKWGPLFNPGHRYFVATWSALGGGLANTVAAAALTVVFALVIGTVLAVLRITSSRAWRWAVVGLIELLRGLPVIITIYFASRVLPELGITLPPLWDLVVGLTAYNCVIIAEILRAGVSSLPRGQREAALAVGLTPGATMRLVLLPQAVRVMLPALISQVVVILKDTSLAAVLGIYIELLRQGNLISLTLDNPIQMLTVVGLIFILLNYLLSKAATLLERRLSRSSTRGDDTATEASAPLATTIQA